MDSRGTTPNIQEDTIILALIRQHGTNQWTTVASEMKKITSTARTSKQIREM